MLQHLDYDQFGQGRTYEQARAELDSQLGVSMWWNPFGGGVETAPVDDPEAPWWWRGDEEASQSFLKEMGVVIPGA